MPASRETAMDRDRDFRIVVSVLTPAFFNCRAAPRFWRGGSTDVEL